MLSLTWDEMKDGKVVSETISGNRSALTKVINALTLTGITSFHYFWLYTNGERQELPLPGSQADNEAMKGETNV